MKIYVSLLLLFSSISSIAQSTLFLGEQDGSKYYLVSSSEPTRVGKGVITWIIDDFDGLTFANKHYFSCDGKFASESLSFEVSSKDSFNSRTNELIELFKLSRGKISTSWASFNEFEEVKIPFKTKIKSNLKYICGVAKNERKDDLLPFIKSSFDKNNTAKLSYLMTGHFTRNQEIVNGWIKTYPITRKEMKKPNGEVILDSAGEPRMTQAVKDDGYSLEKWSANCRNGKIALSSFNDYDKDNQVRSPSINSERLDYTDTVPGTKGESIATVFCMIY